MFDSLDPDERKVVDRGWSLLMYSIFGFYGLALLILGVQSREHDWLGLAIGGFVSLLSSIWFITTIKSPAPVTRRELRIRSRTLLFILLAYEIAYTVAGHRR